MPVKIINPEIAVQAQVMFKQACAYHQSGNLTQAQALYERILEIDSHHFDALRLFGYLAHQTNKHQMAIELIARATVINPRLESLYSTMSLALQALGKLDDALISCDKAIELKPDFFEAYYNRGNILRDQKKPEQALIDYKKAIALRPDIAEIHTNCGLALCDLRRPEEALISYGKAIALKPNLDKAHNNRGNALSDLMRLDEALLSYDKAIALNPGYADAYCNRGNTLFKLKRLDEALVNYDKAILLAPAYVAAYYSRGLALRDAMRLDAAQKDFEKTLQLNPNHYPARWMLGFMDIPVIFDSEYKIELSRDAFSRALADLDAWFDVSGSNAVEDAIANTLHFYLAYQEKNNKELLSRCGRLTRLLMERWQSATEIKSSGHRPSEGKVKVGIVSSHVRDHSVWEAIAKGWLLNFDSSRFEWHVFSLVSVPNATTELIRSKATSFVEKAGSLKEWASSIVEKRIEVLIYPEIGMDVLTAKLANLRLAPIQIATWGHPETTGLETIDYYLSAELLEPENADLNYTETLVKLPNLGCTCAPPRVVPGSLDLYELGINPETPILLCPGTAYKYSPKHDGVFPQIAQLLGACTFVFFDQAPHLTDILRLRLKAVFEQSNLVMEDYVKFIPWLSRENFYGLMRVANVFMDTIGFSGFNTAMQAMECSLPVVTIDGHFMRGRLASGILKRLHLNELICDSEQAYCDVVVRLVRDARFKAEVVFKIEDRRSALYGDMEPMRALEAFLLDKCRPNA